MLVLQLVTPWAVVTAGASYRQGNQLHYYPWEVYTMAASKMEKVTLSSAFRQMCNQATVI